ncbi:hypothetical protein IQ251_18905 [Saccharopolyspora sp. HNM0983]|uniref:DUF3558 domain-containing protein n=1 Tax=Saccharopolyspora montiporae TaxID=2781240 RepID=A0A929BDU4_9PSEU|nr:hypothetical protein [Saccharopolyspora sp. HNM0983]MBE9376525.1 hypothetical protein [Saccharopolyspora sp. HNM0983]
MAALNGIRAGVLCLGLVVVASGCAPPAQGYRDEPGACSVLSDASVVEQLGPEAVDIPNTADVEDGDESRSSTCEWESLHPPHWGSPATAWIKVTTHVSITDNREPDPETARERYRYSGLAGETPDAPPDVIGDASRQRFRPGDGGLQIVEVDALRANARITVEYSGGGNRDFVPYSIPREQHERATRDMARDVLRGLGPPQ